MKKYFLIQSLVLFLGVLFSWATVAGDFIRYQSGQGTNPLTTPCFYGAMGFLLAYFYSLYIYFQKPDMQKRHQKYLVIFLISGTLFGWGNFTLEFCKFYFFKNPTSCSGLAVSTPFATPCFYGSVIYLMALISGILTLKKQKKDSTS